MIPKTKTSLLIIRHGETLWNAERRFQGHEDSPLSELGRSQVTALGQRMKNMKFDSLISSDLGRTRETAAIITGFTGHAVELDSRIRERNYGVLEGLTVDEIMQQHADVLERLKTDDPDYLPPGGESHRQHYQRNADFFEEILEKRAGFTIAVVAHGGVLDSMFRYVSSLPLDHPRCFIAANASLTTVSHGKFYGTPRWVIETWCETGHLDMIEN